MALVASSRMRILGGGCVRRARTKKEVRNFHMICEGY